MDPEAGTALDDDQIADLICFCEIQSPIQVSEDLSRAARAGDAVRGSLAYGELSLRDTVVLVQRVSSLQGGLSAAGTCIDLGSGAGLALLATRCEP